MHKQYDSNKLGRWASVVIGLLLLVGCAVTPRTSAWEVPTRFTQVQVFNAGLKAGADLGWRLTGSDREAGTMSFHNPMGVQELVFSATVRSEGKMVRVTTTAHIAMARSTAVMAAPAQGQHEIYIKNFHTMLFRNLGVTKDSEQNVKVEVLK